MTYSIEITASAKKEMGGLPASAHRRIAEAILSLKSNPRPRPKSKKLRSPHEGYRIRIGTWRVLYVVNDEASLVIVYAVRHRREAYRRSRKRK